MDDKVVSPTFLSVPACRRTGIRRPTLTLVRAISEWKSRGATARYKAPVTRQGKLPPIPVGLSYFVPHTLEIDWPGKLANG